MKKFEWKFTNNGKSIQTGEIIIPLSLNKKEILKTVLVLMKDTFKLIKKDL